MENFAQNFRLDVMFSEVTLKSIKLKFSSIKISWTESARTLPSPPSRAIKSRYRPRKQIYKEIRDHFPN